MLFNTSPMKAWSPVRSWLDEELLELDRWTSDDCAGFCAAKNCVPSVGGAGSILLLILTRPDGKSQRMSHHSG